MSPVDHHHERLREGPRRVAHRPSDDLPDAARGWRCASRRRAAHRSRIDIDASTSKTSTRPSFGCPRGATSQSPMNSTFITAITGRATSAPAPRRSRDHVGACHQRFGRTVEADPIRSIGSSLTVVRWPWAPPRTSGPGRRDAPRPGAHPVGRGQRRARSSPSTTIKSSGGSTWRPHDAPLRIVMRSSAMVRRCRRRRRGRPPRRLELPHDGSPDSVRRSRTGAADRSVA